MSDDGILHSRPAYQLSLHVEEEYLLAQAAGPRTWATVSALAAEIMQAALEHQRGKVLVDVRELEGWLSGLSSYLVVTEDFRRFRGKGIKKAAIVDRPRPNIRSWFFENVARNRGFNVRIFVDPEVALDWLLDRTTGIQ
jgi:hypothetical protein